MSEVVGEGILRIRTDDSAVDSDVDGAGRRAGKGFTKGFSSGIKGLAVAVGATLAAKKVLDFAKGAVAEAREAAKVSATTNQIIKATGGAANVSADYVGKLATALSFKNGVDDEAIQTGANLILTFKNVRNEAGLGANIFDRATASAIDLSAAGFGSIDSASKSLGKALNDPLKGISALGRAGVTFTAKQKEQIKTLVEANDILGAQKIILKEVEGQVGGVAAATATSGDKAKVAFGNLQEQIGGLLLPVIDKLADVFVYEIAPAIRDFVTQLQTGEGAGGKVAAVFRGLGEVLSTVGGFINDNRGVFLVFVGTIIALTVAVTALNIVLAINPITLVVIAVAALVAGLYYLYNRFETARIIMDAVWAVLKRVASAVMNNKQVLLALLGPVGLVAAAFITLYKKSDTFRGIVQGIIGVVKGASLAFGAFVITLTTKVAGAVDAVVRGFKLLPSLLKALPDKMRRLGGDIIDAFLQGLRSAGSFASGIADSVWQAVKGVINSAIDQLNNLLEFTIKLTGAPDIHVNPPNLGHLQGGSRRTAGGQYLVGEVGPELVTLPSGARVDTAAQTQQALGSGFDYARFAEVLAAVLSEALEALNLEVVTQVIDPRVAAAQVLDQMATA